MENTNTPLIIGTRGSKLALWQAHYTQQQLEAVGIASELRIIKTKGDRIQHLSFDKIEGKGFFTKEIEEALLRGEIDLAVHSMKDMPTEQPEGLCITAVSYRANPADVLILRKAVAAQDQLLQLPQGATVGTSSARRKAQLLDVRSDIQLKDIRGNVPTRLAKLQEGQFDAILLAAAGLERLQIELEEFTVVPLNPKEFVPAPAQGVLAWQCCRADKKVRRMLQQIHQKETAVLTNIERKVLQLMDGGCHMPLGAYCEKDAQNNYHIWATVADSWDAPLRRVQRSSSTSFQLAEQVVEALKEKAI